MNAGGHITITCHCKASDNATEFFECSRSGQIPIPAISPPAGSGSAAAAESSAAAATVLVHVPVAQPGRARMIGLKLKIFDVPDAGTGHLGDRLGHVEFEYGYGGDARSPAAADAVVVNAVVARGGDRAKGVSATGGTCHLSPACPPGPLAADLSCRARVLELQGHSERTGSSPLC